MLNFILDRDHSFSTYAKLSEKLTFLPLIRARTYAYEGVNVNFSENFVHVLNKWYLLQSTLNQNFYITDNYIRNSCTASRPNPFKFFKGCLPQNLLSPLLNTLSHI